VIDWVVDVVGGWEEKTRRLRSGGAIAKGMRGCREEAKWEWEVQVQVASRRVDYVPR